MSGPSDVILIHPGGRGEEAGDEIDVFSRRSDDHLLGVEGQERTEIRL